MLLFQLELKQGGIFKVLQSPVCAFVCPFVKEECLMCEQSDQCTLPAMLTYL